MTPAAEWNQILRENAAAYARVAMDNIGREFPNGIYHTMSAPGDFPGRPRDRNPVFYGSYDWHSCVEMHWLLIRLLRTAADSVPAGEIRATLDRQFAPEALAAEAAYVAGPDSPGRYGWGWALALVHEASALASPARARPTRTPAAGRPRWLRWPPPSPASFLDWLPRATYPVRYGVHPNTAFALSRSLPHARDLAAAGDPALADAIEAAATGWYSGDADYPAAWEPSGADFLSPALTEAELMALLLPDGRFADWLGGVPARHRARRARGPVRAGRRLRRQRRSDRAPARAEREPGLVLAPDRREPPGRGPADRAGPGGGAAARRRGAAARGRRPLQRRALARRLRGAAADLTGARSLRCRGEHAEGSDGSRTARRARVRRHGRRCSGCSPTTCSLDPLGDDAPVVAALAAAPDPDLALAGLARLGPDERLLDALRSDPGLRARLAAVLGTSTALADHLRRHPADWQLLSGAAAERAPGAERAAAPTCSARREPDQLRVAYRRRLLRLAARDLTGVTAIDDVMAELADLAGAALEAALAIATAPAAAGRRRLPARRDRDGQVRRARAELLQRRRRDLRGRARRAGRRDRRAADGDPAGQRDDPGVLRDRARGQPVPGRSQPAPGGPQRPAGPDPGQSPRLLPALGQDLGVPGAAQGQAGRRRPRGSARTTWPRWSRWSGTRRSGTTSSPTSRRCGGGSSPACRPAQAGREIKLGPGGLRDIEFAVQLLQLVHGRADETLRDPGTLPALAALADGGYVGQAGRGEHGRRPTGSCGWSSTCSSSASCGGPTRCRPTRRSCARSAGRCAPMRYAGPDAGRAGRAAGRRVRGSRRSS